MYLALIEQVLAKKKQVIVLIPEISLTYQTVRRFYERFGERIAVINSRMSKGEKSDACERIRAGEADVIIGAKNKDTLIFVNEMEAVAGNVYIATRNMTERIRVILLRNIMQEKRQFTRQVFAVQALS